MKTTYNRPLLSKTPCSINFLSILLSIIILVFSCLPTIAQNESAASLDSLLQDFGTPGQFVIKGQAKQFKRDFFEFVITGFGDNERMAVPVDKDGHFEKSFPVILEQDIYLYLNGDAITFSVGESDTLEIQWDEADFQNTFSAHSNNTHRNPILSVQWDLYQRFRKPNLTLQSTLWENRQIWTEQEKFDKINDLFNQEVQLILDHSDEGKKPFAGLLVGRYFEYCQLLNDAGLLGKKDLTIDTTYNKVNHAMVMAYPILSLGPQYRIQSEAWFCHVPAYRDFIYTYVRMSRPFNIVVNDYSYPSSYQLTSSLYQSIYRVWGSTSSILMRDWFVANIVSRSFRYDSFALAENAFEKFSPDIHTAYFRSLLSNSYQAAKALKPGLQAPPLALMDTNGKMVNLSDFRGKVVYIDFWGVYCGPCIQDIQQAVPKLHEAYKDKDVVFMNICVDVDEARWKAALEKYKLDGINLIAPGWSRNPAIEAYRIKAIPHYLIINRDGTIANNNAPRAIELLNMPKNENELEKALAKP
ncbi:TlpA family protein disulfide reductase [Olivibacter sitiensis]|uniref:TlpA family protein disulfide reductase n=1 Tax=Olivibacter sitiensis TaxID=376470 RepID=UPI0003FE222A|nr:TlpA disulfide reductase family protein [Olivibacter sitiensis]